jgi:hypothetical protein
MGLEPTTFCMASRPYCAVAPALSLQIDHFCAAGTLRLSPDFVAFRRGCVPQLSPDIMSHVSSAAPRAPRRVKSQVVV